MRNGILSFFLCLWFRASLIYINNCPTRCNTKQSIYYSASSLNMFRLSTTPFIRSTQNCNYSLRYCAVLCTPNDGCGWHPKHVEWTCRIINRLLCVASRWRIINILCQMLKSRNGTDLPSLQGGRESRVTSPGIWKETVIAYLKVMSCNLPGSTEEKFRVILRR